MALNREVCFVHLGKFGDLMIMLPAFKAVFDQMGKPPICMVSHAFASIFDGVSYVKPWVVPLHWWKGVKTAREMATSAGYDPIVVKWWDEPDAKPPMQLETGKCVTLTVHGQKRVVPALEWDSYQASQWRYAGFTVQQMLDWPLVFDRRSPEREAELRARHFKSDKPHVLLNLAATGSSPFKYYREVVGYLMSADFEIVNLAGVKAHRIYDLLGLYDHAAGLVTSDTATLHLAAASQIPYIAFLNNGGSGSVPRGNCVLALRYSQVKTHMGYFVNAIKRFDHNLVTA